MYDRVDVADLSASHPCARAWWPQSFPSRSLGSRCLSSAWCVAFVFATTLALVACGDDAQPTDGDPRCGDGVVDEGETCDDGNLEDGDGCSHTCDVERGWTCSGEPSVCTANAEVICGDGVLGRGEGCDDGNLDSGDGCSSSCGVEDGWTCTGEPSVCEPAAGGGGTCGDGVVDGGESCDDGNVDSGDGCSSTCRVEAGWTCAGQPSVCVRSDIDDETPEGCGDGVLDDDEACDDGNMVDGDGCSARCEVEEGWRCAGEPSVCTLDEGTEPTEPGVCGDGILDDGEECDDGNTLNDDGCSADCQVEEGWRCEGAPSDCYVACTGAVDCAGVVTTCRTGACNLETGRCETQSRAENASCTPTGTCNVGGRCEDGLCVGQARDCSHLDEPCAVGVCSPEIDACTTAPLGDGEACGDATECTAAICQGGACIHSDEPSCTACGDGSFCGGGVCGGASPDRVWTFADGEVPDDLAMSGTLPWVVVAEADAEDGFVIRSGAITHNQSTTMSITLEIFEPTEVSFRFRMGSEECCDGLEFYIDGARMQAWAGSIPWTTVSFALAPGTRTLRWTYSKDGSVSTSPDAVFIDRIEIGGLRPPCDLACGTSVYDGESCVMCDPVEVGTDCSDPDDPCMVGSCTADGCVYAPVEDGTTCATSEACVAYVCESGACAPQNAPICTVCGDGVFCAGGACGGLLGTSTWDFEGGALSDRFEMSGSLPWTVVEESTAGNGFAMRSGSITHNQSTSASLTVDVGPDAAVAFRFRMGSEPCCDKLRFFVDGVERGEWGGARAWELVTFPLPEGERTLRWTYSKDHSITTSPDAVWIDVIEVSQTDPECDEQCGLAVYDGDTCVTCDAFATGTDCSVPSDPCSVGTCTEDGCEFSDAADGVICGDEADCFADVCRSGSCVRENASTCTSCADETDYCAEGVCGGLPDVGFWDFATGTFPDEFTFGGTTPWVIDTSESQSHGTSARAGAITHSQTSSMSTLVTIEPGGGTVSFDYLVSSEACCDRLRFRVDGAERLSVGGNVGWETATYELAPGIRELEWRYTKDPSVTAGRDTAWVDNIRVEGVAPECVNSCGIGVIDATGCVLCETFEEGSDCSDPDETCATGLCTDGVCEVSFFDDCSVCDGPDGLSVCASGRCGGLPTIQSLGPAGSFAESGFTTGGNLPWTLSAASGPSGAPIATSGAITHNQFSFMETTVEVAQESTVSMFINVSSESGFDFGLFQIDGVTVGSWSGSHEWFETEYVLTPGTRTLRWEYTKDGSASAGADQMRVSDIRIDAADLCLDEDACTVGVYDGTRCLACIDPICD